LIAKILNLGKTRLTIFSLFLIPLLAIFFINPAYAASPISSQIESNTVLHISTVDPGVVPLAASSDPNGPVGGVPFCFSGSLGTLLCYTPSFLKSAYNFPSTTGRHGLDGTGSTIVIVDAFGSPTIRSDINKYDSAIGLPPVDLTILCGPTWTGSPSDVCPVTTIGDMYTATNAGVCGAPGWAEETTLDVVQAHSLAPGAKIVLVVANDCYDTSLYTAELAVVNQPRYSGSIMSQSFGEPDDLVTCTALNSAGTACATYDPSLLNLPNQVFQMAEQHHWTVIASSGDLGANEDAETLGTLELTPSFPATSPLVLAAGGTQGNPYGGQYGPPPGTSVTGYPSSNCESSGVTCAPLSCPANTNCNTGLVLINGGPDGCTTAARPGLPSSCTPVGYGGESTWDEVPYLLELGTTSGGGISSLYSRPFYQFDTPPVVTTLLGQKIFVNGRTTPDVSFNAAAQGGVLAWTGFLDDSVGLCTGTPCPGDWVVFSGTSAASPAWAAIIALLDQANHGPVGFINPEIYQLGIFNLFAHSFHDITSGTNAVCSGLCGEDGFVATPGYDLTTGWGSPNVSNFINNMLVIIGH